MQKSSAKSSTLRLNGFTANTLWHRRMSRLPSGPVPRVHPRICAELVVRSIVTPRSNLASLPNLQSRESLDACHAA
ncbi:MAG TPA: hypothetical protein VFT72_15035 [Opitutaceae bacterium]|nr:hypothetical protein [Opitutaceae bacterium]